MEFEQKVPCRECPFRRRSMRGWLGSGTSESFMATVLADYPMPCHLTVDYENEHWQDDLDLAQYCAGALIFFSNICKLSRDPKRPKLPGDSKTIFANVKEFMDYHGTRTK